MPAGAVDHIDAFHRLPQPLYRPKHVKPAQPKDGQEQDPQRIA
jgi:hypothetical protein